MIALYKGTSANKNAATMAARNIITAAKGARAANRSWRVGERLRHHLRHQRAGAAMADGSGAGVVSGLVVSMTEV